MVFGPGRYLPQCTEGITRPEDLPEAKLIRRSRNYRDRPSAKCGKSCFPIRTCMRIAHDVGDLIVGRPRDIEITFSQHRCSKCKRFFSAATSEYAAPKSLYTHRVIALAVRLVLKNGLPYQTASWQLWRDRPDIAKFLRRFRMAMQLRSF